MVREEGAASIISPGWVLEAALRSLPTGEGIAMGQCARSQVVGLGSKLLSSSGRQATVNK